MKLKSLPDDALPQDEPLREWVGYDGCRKYQEEYLNEELRLESRGSAALKPCSCDNNNIREHLFHCVDCFGVEMLCQSCCMAAHRWLPLHRIKVSSCNFEMKVCL
ncbi:hypothetical protein PAXRUDRAFT_155706 [Paxillus rubicundulus Ve08.2h10]|uniref:Uncharacterized protein n=1 Tax=Paxillus rubicundulus Ve08.2h10 TaxID=930991 RepID=A0A0D0DBW4_9AGAM|nr:hypothetical protein PAXRUDRAFT_155706 [Paxillus rubicundulus Ve08.2h10]